MDAPWIGGWISLRDLGSVTPPKPAMVNFPKVEKWPKMPIFRFSTNKRSITLVDFGVESRNFYTIITNPSAIYATIFRIFYWHNFELSYINFRRKKRPILNLIQANGVSHSIALYLLFLMVAAVCCSKSSSSHNLDFSTRVTVKLMHFWCLFGLKNLMLQLTCGAYAMLPAC